MSEAEVEDGEEVRQQRRRHDEALKPVFLAERVQERSRLAGPEGNGQGVARADQPCCFLRCEGAWFAFRHSGIVLPQESPHWERGRGETGMPVWGEVFRAPNTAPVGEQLQGAKKRLRITHHVESIQEK